MRKLFCGCNPINETPSGGAVASGSATVELVTDRMLGGIVCGGSARVDVPTQCLDEYELFYCLVEDGNGTPDEYQDSSPYGHHGQGDEGEAEFTPTQDDGLFCSTSQRFEGRQYITGPSDRIGPASPITVSLWGLNSQFYSDRAFYSRGKAMIEGETGWTLVLGHTFLNTVTASVQVVGVDGEWLTYTAWGTNWLPLDTWHHYAVVWRPGESLTVYVDGDEEGSVAVTETNLVPSEGNYVGRWNDASYLTGNVQELRVVPVARSAEWLLAEHDNFCSNDFYAVGGVETVRYS
jgi:hypothetical protein